jgi:RNA polymerase sigma-70 factor (sigma-E family)
MEFEEYAGARWPVLFRTAVLLTGDEADADDLAQATLVKAYAAWSRVQRADSPDAYVRRMLVNEFLSDHRRTARRRARLPLAVPEQPITDDPALRLDLWANVVMLPPRQRAVLVLRFYEDLTEAETARVLSVSVGTVKSQAHDALRTLRTRLEEVPS